jgi:hypothetical protein
MGRPPRRCVDRARHELLSGSARPGDEHVRALRCDEGDGFAQAPGSCGFADDSEAIARPEGTRRIWEADVRHPGRALNEEKERLVSQSDGLAGVHLDHVNGSVRFVEQRAPTHPRDPRACCVYRFDRQLLTRDLRILKRATGLEEAGPLTDEPEARQRALVRGDAATENHRLAGGKQTDLPDEIGLGARPNDR